MTRLFMLFFIFGLSFHTHLFSAKSIEGFWAKLNENLTPRTIFAIYSHKNIYYGKIIATFTKDGQLHESLSSSHKDIATAVVGNPPIVGLDIIWGLKEIDDKFTEGTILDPVEGKTYKLDAWIESDNYLNVRGKLLFFWKDMHWKKVSLEQLKELKIDYPDLKSLTPKTLKIKNDK